MRDSRANNNGSVVLRPSIPKDKANRMCESCPAEPRAVARRTGVPILIAVTLLISPSPYPGVDKKAFRQALTAMIRANPVKDPDPARRPAILCRVKPGSVADRRD